MNTSSEKTLLSLEAFADMVLKDDSWQSQMPHIMEQMPSVDEAVVEMARMPEEKREALRLKVAHMQDALGQYIGELGIQMRQQRGVIESARSGTQASNAYSKTDSLVKASQ